MNVRERTAESAPLLISRKKSDEGPKPAEHRLLDGYVEEEELWDCTTCRACMEECPVAIEHVPVIMEMRRYLVLTESRFPAELTPAYKGLENSYNPWGFSPDSRADWARDLDVPTMAQTNGDAEILFWVGCAGSFDSRYQKVSRAMVKLMKAARVSFAILGKEEKCNGDPARRSGNEYLAQMLISENIETLNRYKVKNIVTACPHCFNALKNDYPQFGGNYEVVHHTEFLTDLIRIGKLRIDGRRRERVAFHDSCYIGRYNRIYDIPRHLVARSGASLAKMRRSQSRGFCCGAGGGQMFLGEEKGKRVNVERAEELAATGAQVIGTACPFCQTMFRDALGAAAGPKPRLMDIAQLAAASLPAGSPEPVPKQDS
jgi:Fe-S oxidoreductase